MDDIEMDNSDSFSTATPIVIAPGENVSAQDSKNTASKHKCYLEKLLKEGLTSCITSPLFKEAMNVTKLTKGQLQNFIYNQRKPDRGKKKISIIPKNQYTAFLSQKKDNDVAGLSLAEITRHRAAQYRRLKKTKEGQKVLQKYLQEQVLKRQNLSGEDAVALRRRLVRESLARLDKEIKNLQKLDHDALVLLKKDGKMKFLGTSEMITRAQECEKDPSFKDMLNKLMIDGPGVSGELNNERRHDLRVKVQQLFNRLHTEATGKYGPLPYKQLQQGHDIALTGGPDSICFKPPREYRVKQMKEILEAKDQLKMIIRAKTDFAGTGQSQQNIKQETDTETDVEYEITTLGCPKLEDGTIKEIHERVQFKNCKCSGCGHGIDSVKISDSVTVQFGVCTNYGD